MSLFKKIFGNKDKSPKSSDTEEQTAGLDKFKSKVAEDRLRDIMILGDSGHPMAFEVIEYAILNDQDSGVVMAALKRLPKFQKDERLAILLDKLSNKTDIKNYEPYYSMALLNLGKISKDEFNRRVSS